MSVPESNRFAGLTAAHAVLQTVRHILSVSTDLGDARRQVEQLLALVRAKAEEEQVPAAMLREEGRDALKALL